IGAEAARQACLMLDADAFKSINDSYGHRKGDDVLQELAQRITAAVRDYDLVGRYGGEEFIVVVPELDPEYVVRMAGRLHHSVRATPLAGVRLTVSVGVAFVHPDDERADDLIQRADRALYAAKRAGRDQVSVENRGERTPGGATPAGDMITPSQE
ncbi:MAG: GGDEF domain-containing protein, partial [Spirochaetota bacterium]